MHLEVFFYPQQRETLCSTPGTVLVSSYWTFWYSVCDVGSVWAANLPCNITCEQPCCLTMSHVSVDVACTDNRSPGVAMAPGDATPGDAIARPATAEQYSGCTQFTGPEDFMWYMHASTTCKMNMRIMGEDTKF